MERTGKGKKTGRASALVAGGEKFVKIMSNLVAAVHEVGGKEADLDRLDRPGTPLLLAIARLIHEPEARVISDPEERLVADMIHANVRFENPWLEPSRFVDGIDDVGDGYVVDHPLFDEDTDGIWSKDVMSSWFEEIVGKGYEPATVADGLRFVSDGRLADGESIICAGSKIGSRGDYWPSFDRARDTVTINEVMNDDGFYHAARFLLRQTEKTSAKAKVEPKPSVGADAESYGERFARAVEEAGFTEWNQGRLTPTNFPDEELEVGDYDLVVLHLPPSPGLWAMGGFHAIVAGMMNLDRRFSVARLGDGLAYAKEVKEGKREWQSWRIICPGSVSKDGGLLELYRDESHRQGRVTVKGQPLAGDLAVLLRRAKKPAKEVVK